MTLAVFDLDGTLADSRLAILEAQRRAFAALGLPAPSPEAGLSIVGLSLPEAFVALAGPDGPTPELCAAYRAAAVAMRDEAAYAPRVFAGADAALRRLKAQGATLGVATGMARRGVTHLFAQTGWEPLFATVQTADGHPSKPAPDMTLAAMAETGAAPHETVMIGDSTYDMLMAKAAGARALGVGWGFHTKDALLAAGAEAVVADFDELLHLIGA
ncbi:HAD-IA family hydrolase [Methylocella sp.]|uniref:HAD-IA family hydrolase n=1 Tax=Methylocella sp. TaxID=1978226 RepID=UPI003783A450